MAGLCARLERGSLMIDSPAENFAQVSLLNHAHEGTFTVGITGIEEGEAVARAFECLGCTVEPLPFDLQLRVTAPPTAA
jgi:hypothetical protein